METAMGMHKTGMIAMGTPYPLLWQRGMGNRYEYESE